MKFEVYIPDEFIEELAKQDEIKRMVLNRPHNYLIYIICDFFKSRNLHKDELDKMYTKVIDYGEIKDE
jgi:hypothetical protein